MVILVNLSVAIRSRTFDLNAGAPKRIIIPMSPAEVALEEKRQNRIQYKIVRKYSDGVEEIWDSKQLIPFKF